MKQNTFQPSTPPFLLSLGPPLPPVATQILNSGSHALTGVFPLRRRVIHHDYDKSVS